MSRVDDIRARAEAATRGPWEVRDLSDRPEDNLFPNGWWWVWRADNGPYYNGVAEVSDVRDPVGGETADAICIPSISDHDSPEREYADAEFIAHAREDIPFLLERDAAATALIEDMVKQIVALSIARANAWDEGRHFGQINDHSYPHDNPYRETP